MDKQFSIKSIITAVVAVIGAIGFFLPWASASALGISVTVVGTEASDGWIIFVLLAAAAVLALINLKKDPTIIFQAGISAVSAIAVVMALIKIINVLNNQYASVNIGLWLILIAGIATAILPWLPIKKKA